MYIPSNEIRSVKMKPSSGKKEIRPITRAKAGDLLVYDLSGNKFYGQMRYVVDDFDIDHINVVPNKYIVDLFFFLNRRK